MKKLTNIQREILIGILLGDANLQTFNNGITYRLQILQKNQEYCEHLYKVFQNFVTTPPKPIITKKGEIIWYFNTLTHPCFRFYGQQFYSFENNKTVKKIPKFINKLVTPCSIAYWFMDDSSAKLKTCSNAVRFCTDNFSKIEVKYLCDIFIKKYNIKAIPQKHRKDHYRIYILEESGKNLRNIIFPFLRNEMMYKCPKKWFD